MYATCLRTSLVILLSFVHSKTQRMISLLLSMPRREDDLQLLGKFLCKLGKWIWKKSREVVGICYEGLKPNWNALDVCWRGLLAMCRPLRPGRILHSLHWMDTRRRIRLHRSFRLLLKGLVRSLTCLPVYLLSLQSANRLFWTLFQLFIVQLRALGLGVTPRHWTIVVLCQFRHLVQVSPCLKFLHLPLLGLLQMNASSQSYAMRQFNSSNTRIASEQHLGHHRQKQLVKRKVLIKTSICFEHCSRTDG